MGEQHSLANKVAFAFVAGSAGVQALQQALKDAPDLVRNTWVPDMNVGAWNYLPLVLVSLGAFIWVLERSYRAGFASPAPAVVPSPPVGPQIVESVGKPPASSAREYLPATFSRSLIAMLRKRYTEAELAALLRPHVGQWVRVSFYLRNAIPGREDIHVIVGPSRDGLGTTISTSFSHRNEPLFARMKRGQRFDCDLRIVQDANKISLQDGEIL